MASLSHRQARSVVDVIATALAPLPLTLAAPLWPLAFGGARRSNGLPALRAELLAQLKAGECSGGGQVGLPVPRARLIQDNLRILLWSLVLAQGFAVDARRVSWT